MSARRSNVSIDLLQDAHEWLNLPSEHKREILHAGRAITLRLPECLAQFEVLKTALAGDLLFVIGRREERYRDARLGVVLIARRTEDNAFVVQVWHEIFPWTIEQLGFTEGSECPPEGHG